MIIRPPPKLTNRSSYVKFIETDLWTWMRDLSISKTSFKDNFRAFIIEDLEIPATKEVEIANQLQVAYPGLIPTGRIVIRQQGDANIIDGVTPWTEDLLYLYNPSANDAIVSVLFFIEKIDEEEDENGT